MKRVDVRVDRMEEISRTACVLHICIRENVRYIATASLVTSHSANYHAPVNYKTVASRSLICSM